MCWGEILTGIIDNIRYTKSEMKEEMSVIYWSYCL